MPLPVVMVICADVSPTEGGGTVTVHTFCDGQLVGVTCPLKDATIRPSGLRKLEPVTVTAWPGLPEVGVIDEICGGAPGVDGALVVVFTPEVVVVEAPFVVVVTPGRPGCVVEAAVGDGPPDPRLADTASAIPVATTRTATTTTATTSRRSDLLPTSRSLPLVGPGSVAGTAVGGRGGAPDPTGGVAIPWLARARRARALHGAKGALRRRGAP